MVMIAALTMAGGGGVVHQFLILVLVLAIIWGLLYCIETWIHPIPSPIKLVLAIVLLIFVVLWALQQFGVSGL